MSDALNATGRPIVYSLCNWGNDNPFDCKSQPQAMPDSAPRREPRIMIVAYFYCRGVWNFEFW